MEREYYYSKDGTKVMVVASIGELESIVERMDRFKYKYDHMLVIGNGFDLNLGLRTTYRDFVNSCIFKRLYVNRMEEKTSNGKPIPSLIDYLYGKKFIEKWYDIEQALIEYVTIRADGSYVNNVDEDKKDYELLCSALIKYLVSLFKSGDDLKQSEMMRESSAGLLLQTLSSDRNVIYSFNYTPIELILKAIYADSSMKPLRVHGNIEEQTIFKGNIKDNAIILGIETDNIGIIAPGYSFLLKSNNPSYKSTNIASDLLKTKHVIFFGHSFNQMDFGYFREYFRVMTSNVDRERKITIFTKDEISRVALLDNLRVSGISVRDIYAHTNIDIILTDDLNKQGTESNRHFGELLKEIKNDR